MVAYTFSAIFLIISMRIRRWPTQQLVASMVTTPILFLSNAFYPESRIPTALAWLVELNPVSHAIAITRELFFQGGPALTSTLIWNFSILVAFVILVTLVLMVAARRWL
jgi:ABC-2 type transport system permease protein